MAKDVSKARNDSLRALLTDARKSVGLTQVDLAERLGRPQSFVSKYERGERRLDVVEFLEVTDALDVAPAKLIERIWRPDALFLNNPDSPPKPERDTTAGELDTILDRWSVTPRELTALVDDNPSLRGIMLGYVAEHKLRELVEAHAHISATRKYDDHDRKRKSDRVLIYKGEEFTVEVKSLQTNLIKKDGTVWRGRAQVDGSDRRIVTFPDGTKLNTTLLLRGQFDILAVNCFAFQNRWHFAFALNRDLPKSTFKKYTESQRDQLIASLVPVSWPPEPPFEDDPFPLVERLYQERLQNKP